MYPFDRESLARYFTLLHYEFTEEYQRGLRRFYELAYEAGELEEVPELRFIDDVAGDAGEIGRATGSSSAGSP